MNTDRRRVRQLHPIHIPDEVAAARRVRRFVRDRSVDGSVARHPANVFTDRSASPSGVVDLCEPGCTCRGTR